MTDYSTLLVSSSQGVATITLNRPERRNAIGPRMSNELLYALSGAFEDPEVRCVVLTGAGDSFCAGGDFSEMTAPSAAQTLPTRGDFADLLLTLMNAPKPVIARVNGHAMGGGLGLVAASTFAVASRDARLGTPEITVGVFPMMIMAVLVRVISRRQFLEMSLLGGKLSAEDALRVGLVNRVVMPEELDSAIQDMTRQICDKSPIAIRLGLEAFSAQQDVALADALPMLRDKLGACLATDDAREGLGAFLQKRKPIWTGR
ncbi:MAG: enoyl-CoA hydratase/isomerase family protein [Deltaproteobacteria bacterium]|nr:enoyl-CoA hydratase/isomerase family protein [Deltaproteobacteria bacterium]